MRLFGKLITPVVRTACLLILFTSTTSVFGAEAIPAASLAALRAKSAAAKTVRPGSPGQRRAFKRIVRAGNELLATHPDASNRFQLLGLMLKNQQEVIKLEGNDLNRKVLYDICAQLVQAPDTWAGIRLEAELLLSERDLSRRNASDAERGEALKAMITRYRGTKAEPKSLMIAAVITKKLGARDLQRFIEQTMDDRCGGNPEVIVFRRNILSLKSLAVKCEGKYTRAADGTTLYIPGDRMGHQCLLVYWSKTNPATDRFMKEVKEQQERFPGAFEVYSFNLDELPDAGEKYLRGKGLDWQAMRLPNGKQNINYQAYGANNPVALFVNGFGYTVLNPFGVNPDARVGVMSIDGGFFKISESRLSYPRYLAQLQSLFIGDFLITDATAPFDPATPPELKMAAPQKRPTTTHDPRAADIPGDLLRDIQSRFVNPPCRYRLSEKEALVNYRTAEKQCAKAIKKYPAASNLWMARNRRIIALLGMWNLTCEPPYLQQAVLAAQVSLTAPLPTGAEVVAKFCLAKHALRADHPDTPEILDHLVAPAAGADPSPSALAAAAILALDADNRELHEKFRDTLLNGPAGAPPALWDFVAFLRNRYHRFFLLKPNSTRGDRLRGSRYHIVNFGGEPSMDLFPNITLNHLDGSDPRLPDTTSDTLTLLLFVEPPTDPDADFPIVLDRNGEPTRNDYIRHVVSDADNLAAKNINNSVRVILAFISDDPAHVAALMEKNGWTDQALIVPGGLKNPLVRRLGIYSADKVPNVFLLRRDGTIAWHTSGFRYKSEFGYPFALLLGMKVHIEACEVEHGYQALVKRDYKEAAKTFAGPFLPWRPDRFGWRPVRYQGLALAQMALKEWDPALEAIDKAIDARKLRYYRGRRSKAIEDWRQDAATVTVKEPDNILTELWTLKASILEKLGHTEEAKRFERLASQSFTTDHPSIYGNYHHKLSDLTPEIIK